MIKLETSISSADASMYATMQYKDEEVEQIEDTLTEYDKGREN